MSLKSGTLREQPGAPLLEWVETIDQGLERRGLTILLVALFCYLAWLQPVCFLHCLSIVERGWKRWQEWRESP